MTFDALNNADPGIVKLSRDYFDLMHHQNMETFDRVFHPDSVLYGVSDNKLNIRPCAVYRQAMLDRTSPADLGNARRDLVLSFDQISPTLALLKMQLETAVSHDADRLQSFFLPNISSPLSLSSKKNLSVLHCTCVLSISLKIRLRWSSPPIRGPISEEFTIWHSQASRLKIRTKGYVVQLHFFCWRHSCRIPTR